MPSQWPNQDPPTDGAWLGCLFSLGLWAALLVIWVIYRLWL